MIQDDEHWADFFEMFVASHYAVHNDFAFLPEAVADGCQLSEVSRRCSSIAHDTGEVGLNFFVLSQVEKLETRCGFDEFFAGTV